MRFRMKRIRRYEMQNQEFTYSDDLWSDLHKDAFGFRPGSAGWDAWDSSSPEQKQKMWDAAIKEMRESEARQIAAEESAVKEFEAEWAAKLGGEFDKKAAAIQIIAADPDFQYDPDYFCYKRSLPYGYFRDVEMAAFEAAA